jgi:predicted transposase/invertase (TIGR01784 family)
MKPVRLSPDRLVDPRYDKVFKTIFTRNEPASRAALKGFLEAYLHRTLKKIKVVPNELPAAGKTDRQTRYDISCCFDDGELADVEMTLWPDAAEPSRMEYHAGKLYTSQNVSGKKKGYGNLKRAYHLSILGKRNIYKDKAPFHQFEYYDIKNNVAFGGKTVIMTVELRKIEELARTHQPEDLTAEERWAVFFRYTSDSGMLDYINRILGLERGICMAVQVMNGFTQSELETFWKLAREKNFLDQKHQRVERERAERELKKTLTRLDKATAQLDQTSAQLGQTTAQLDEANARIAELERRLTELEQRR